MSLPLNFVLIFISNWLYFIIGTGNPSKNYHPPLDIPLVLSANFGELRSNHFHMGLDFKTQGREGLSLYSIDEGYISRVNVSPYGYGLAVYINHPGGITSVYAHCSKLLGALNEKIVETQIKNQSSEIEIHLAPNEIKVKKGEVFALSGNSGSSQGPHLHFEIRDTYTDEAFNPLLFGFKLADSKKPVLNHLKVYSLTADGFFTGKSKEFKVIKKEGQYVLSEPIVLPSNFISPTGGIGFAIDAIDQFDGASNDCGIYKIQLFSNESLFFSQKLEKIMFEHTRFINGYSDFVSQNKNYHKSFRTISNPLKVYEQGNLGVFMPKLEEANKFKYQISDFQGNLSILDFELKIAKGAPSEEISFSIENENLIHPMKSYLFSNEFGSLEIPKSCTYEPEVKSYQIVQNTVSILSKSTKVQNPYTVRLNPLAGIPVVKQYLKTNERVAIPSAYKNGWIEGKAKFFGETKIYIDELAPRISALNIKPRIQRSKTSRLVWNVVESESGLKDYGILVNGEWKILGYESKGDYAFFKLDELPLGQYTLVIQVSDYCGNINSQSYTLELF